MLGLGCTSDGAVVGGRAVGGYDGDGGVEMVAQTVENAESGDYVFPKLDGRRGVFYPVALACEVGGEFVGFEMFELLVVEPLFEGLGGHTFEACVFAA